MKRKFKTLGIVLASVFAVSAFGASAASAAQFHTAVHPQSVHGVQTTNHVFTTNAGTVSCKTATFTGTTSATTSATQTLSPDYNNCTAFGFINVPIHENGCAYVFNANGTTNVECPAGKAIEVTAPFCTVSVGAQHLPTGMTYASNAGKTDVIATSKVEKITYNECGTVRANGVYHGVTTVTGASGAIWWTV